MKIFKVISLSKYLHEEYKKYEPGVISDALKYASALRGDQVDDFAEHIKLHHNNVFETQEEWDEEIKAIGIAKKLSGGAIEVLGQLVDNPKFDGDVVSKLGKSELYKHGLAVRICTNGEHGDNAANYLGYKVWQCIMRRKAETSESDSSVESEMSVETSDSD